MVVSLRRSVGVLAALAAVLACLSASAGPAHAANPCNSPDPPPTCSGTTTTQSKTFSLTVNVPTGGHITSSPAGIDCTSTCTTSFTISRTCTDGICEEWPPFWTFTLSATGAGGGYEPSWGGCAGSEQTCTVTVDADKSVSASWKDVAPPAVTFDPPAKVGKGAYLSADATDNAGIDHVTWWVDGVNFANVGAAHTALQMALFDEGVHTFAVGATDTSGNKYDPPPAATKTVTIDRSVQLGLGDLPAFTNAATVPLTFTTDADVPASGRLCGVNGSLLGACASPYSPIDASSADGPYTYEVDVTDDVGNTASGTRSVVLDRTLPAVAITGGPGEGQVLTTPATTLTFTATDANLDGVSCKVDGGAFAPCASSLELSGLTAGAHAVTVRAVDKAGNAREVTRAFSYAPPSTGPGGPQPGAPGDPGGPSGPGAPGGGDTPGDGSHGGASPVLVVKAKAAKGVTTITSFLLKGLPKGAKVTIACKGKGCAKKMLVLKSAAGGVLRVKALAGRRLGAGARLTVKVTAPGLGAFSRTVTVRAGKPPLVKA